MEILNQHPNGVALIALKTYDELLPEELEKLSIPSDKKVEYYETFIIHRKKTGEVFRVVGHMFTKEYYQRKKEYPDLVDVLAVFHNNHDRRAYKRAFKRLKHANDHIKRQQQK